MAQRLEQDGPAWLTKKQAADRAGINVSTLLRWETAGHIAPVRTKGGHRRYRPADVDALLDTPVAS